MEESLPFSNIGVNSAPVPIPVTDIAGGELKSVPAVPTNTSTISPLWITAVASPFLPVFTLTSHGLSKFKISEEPYPTPLSVRWIEVISPLTIGWTIAWKSLPPRDDTPTLPITSTLIGL